MAFRLNCLEPVAAMCCAVGAVSLHALDPGLAAGAVIGGVGLFARLRENMRKAGLEAPELTRKMQRAMIREEDRWDQSQEDRDTLTLADAAMTRWLPEVMLTSEALAQSAADKADQPYPRYAALLIVDRLAAKDPLFAAPADGAAPEPLPRRFARTVIERALGVALDDPEYRSRLSVDFLIAISGTLAEIKAQNDATHAKLDARPDTDQVRMIFREEFEKAQAKGVEQSVVLALARRITPMVQSIEEAIIQLGSAIDAFVRQRDAAAQGTNFGDLIDAALREIAARNAVAEFERGAEVAEHAYARLVEQETELKAARIRLAEVNLDQARLLLDPERIAHWHLERLQLEGSQFSSTYAALRAYRNRGQIQSIRLDLDVAIIMARQVLPIARTDHERALIANMLGMSASDQAERTAGAAGLSLFVEAIEAYRVALAVTSQSRMPSVWATTQNNLGTALNAQARRGDDGECVSLLAQASTAFEAALTVNTKENAPEDWAMALNNLAVTRMAQSEMAMDDAEAARLLREAIKMHREVLTVFTKQNRTQDWAATQNNLGGALHALGELTGGGEGEALLVESIAELEAVLSVRSKEAMPARWATTMENIGLAYLALATLQAEPEQSLRAAEHALLQALEVYTPEHMSFYYHKAIGTLAKVREVLAVLKGE
jgi:tetratricopeptide (TPR) repeat protein